MEIKIIYNTISFETKLECNNKTIISNLETEISSNKNKRITDWFLALITKLNEELNNDNYILNIDGCDAYEQDIIAQELGSYPNITTKFKNTNQVREKYKEIDNSISFCLKSKEEIVKKAIDSHRKGIELLNNNTIEIPVIASMSSGKSTLLNALIGQNFLHEDTGATTATTCKIKINNNLNSFKAIVSDNINHIETCESEDKIVQFIKEWNEKANDKKELTLDIEGPISNFKTHNFNVNFIDTPGPNSANKEHHKESTYTYLKDNQNLPIVLYVLDPEKMDSNDDHNTLREISDVIKQKSENLDRIIFILNKIDKEDVEKKSVKTVIEKVIKFLDEKGIKNPKIFPVSAEYAKLTQLKNLSRNEKGALDSFRHKFKPSVEDNYLGFELLKHTPLTQNQKDILNKTITNSEQQADLIYSGMAALKLYIENYIESHHTKYKYRDLNKILTGVKLVIESSFEKSIKDLEFKTEEEKKKQSEKIKKEIKELEKKLELVKESINNLHKPTSFFIKLTTKTEHEFNSLSSNIGYLRKVTQTRAIEDINKANSFLNDITISFNTSLKSMLKDAEIEYIKNLKTVIEQNFNIKDLDKPNQHDANYFKALFINQVNSINIKTISTYTTTHYIEKQKEVESEWFFMRLFGFTDTVTYYEKHSEVNIKELLDDHIRPIKEKFISELENTQIKINDIFDKIKNNFISIIDEEFNKSIDNVYKKHETKKQVSENQIKQDIKNLKALKEKTLTDFKNIA